MSAWLPAKESLAARANFRTEIRRGGRLRYCKEGSGGRTLAVQAEIMHIYHINRRNHMATRVLSATIDEALADRLEILAAETSR